MTRLLMISITAMLLKNVAFAGELQVNHQAENHVKFISTTPLLDFEGKTDKIDGYLYWEGKDMLAPGNELYFEVDLNSVETGIGKRDRDMRNDVLETDKWPTTHFKGTIVSSKTLENRANALQVEVKGTMFIHGVEKQMTISGILQKKGEQLQINSNFSVYLKDFDIKAPGLIAFVKVNEEIKLQLDFTLKHVQ